MTKDDIIRMREQADDWAEDHLQCKGEYHTDFHTVSDERFAALVAAAERERACRIVTGLCISDNNAREINEAIRERPANAHDKVYSEVDLANAYQKGWDDAMLRSSLGMARSTP
jgi:hypothetical protein